MRLPAGLCLCLSLILSLPAWAGTDIEYPTSVSPKQKPTFKITTDTASDGLTLALKSSDGPPLTLKTGKLPAGGSHTFVLPPLKGKSVHYTGVVSARTGLAGMTSNLDFTIDLDESGPPPFRADVAHDEIQFAPKKSTLPPAEVSKLQAALETIRATAAPVEGATLYVVGHTATMGKTPANRKLSEQRAKEIGAWFRKNGLTLPISYVGLGEQGLTGGKTGETVEYIVAADAPELPGASAKNAPRFVSLK